MPDAMCIDVRSKSDLPAHPDWATSKREILPVSAETGSGLSELVENIGERVGWNRLLGGDAVVITRERHLNALESAAEALQRALTATHEKMPWEIVAAELQLALEAVGQIAGHSTIEDVLDQIFREFCIGK